MDSPQPAAPAIVIVDDEQPVALLFRQVIQQAFPTYSVLLAEDPEDVLTIVASRPTAVVITDYMMPHMSGLDLLRNLGRDGPAVILISAFVSPAVRHEAEELGAVAVLEKPFPVRALIAAVRAHLPPE